MKIKIHNAFIIILSLVFSGCAKNIEMREMGYYDYVHIENKNDNLSSYGMNVLKGTRFKGLLIRNSPNDIRDLENYIRNFIDELFSEDFIMDSEKMILESNSSVVNKNIEIDFFRTSNELPWRTDENFVPPYHLGEGNPRDWIGSVSFNINRNEIDYYWVAKRKKGIAGYGKILQKIEYNSIDN